MAQATAVSGYGLSAVGWFSACGLPLELSDRSDARAYLEALSMPPTTRIEPVASWEHAERIIRHPSWDKSWWDREEVERGRLMRHCADRLGPTTALESLSLSAGIEHEVIHGAAAVAATRAGLADPALIRAAAGAASLAAHCHALAKLGAEADTHVFMRKFGLFQAGRWPLGVVGGALHLF
jgi:hypothetical protein